MKKLVFLALTIILISPISISAKNLSIGIHLGISPFGLNIKPIEAQTGEGKEIGGLWLAEIGSRIRGNLYWFFLQADLNYTKSIYGGSGNNNVSIYPDTYTASFINIPIIIGTFLEVTGSGRLYIGAGVTYNLYTYIKTTYQGLSGSKREFLSEKSYDLTILTGVEIEVTDRLSISIDIRTNQGLSKATVNTEGNVYRNKFVIETIKYDSILYSFGIAYYII